MQRDADVSLLFDGSARPQGKVWINPGLDEYFSWEIFKSFLEGVSPIDLTKFPIASLEAAQDFLLRYGVDLNDPADRKDAAEVHGEALEFLHRVLCPAPTERDFHLELPLELTEFENLPRLLLMASQLHHLQAWVCALLRVMHTINHANHAIRSPYYSQIKEQVLGRYREHLRTDEQGRHFLGRGTEAVPLVGVNFREEKSRESLILKLLHKPDNVAQSVYDRIGIKLIVAKPIDALLVLRYFRRHHLAIFANISPGRSRNTLIDLDQVREAWWAQGGDSNPVQAIEEMRRLTFASGSENGAEPNPHSSSSWHSIQFTCRQLVRVQNPIRKSVCRLTEKLQQRLGAEEAEELLRELQQNTMRHEQTFRFFFPYEVQILDEENFRRSETGDSSHANYRLRQLRRARRRVLGRLLAEGSVETA